MKITSKIFEAFLKCPTKCCLHALNETGSGNEYAEWVCAQSGAYEHEVAQRLQETVPDTERVVAPPVAENLKAAKWGLAINLVAQTPDRSADSSVREFPSGEETCGFSGPHPGQILESRLHAVERIPSVGRGKPAQFIPIRFIYRNKLTKDDRLLLAFDAFVLSEMLGREVSLGKIIHGDDRATTKVRTSAMFGEVRKRIEKIAALLSTGSADSHVRESPPKEATRGLGGPRSVPAPDLVLNRHCAECEFRDRCRKIAIEKDDLNLLAGMSAKERQKLRSKGIFTTNQLSYTFRPRRTPKRAKNPGKPHYFALQALAIRENTVYIHGTPKISECKNQVYLDIEGLPDRDLYYLIGALVVVDGQETFHSFWADTVADQTAIFSELAGSIFKLSDFQVFHFGDYDTIALKRIAITLPEATRCGLENILQRSVNVLSLVYPYVYFPIYSNSLKEIGKCLGCATGTLEATGLQSIIWRAKWEANRAAEWKAKLLDYNHTDCLALKKLTEFILGNTTSTTSSEGNGAKVKHTNEFQKARPRWQMFAPKNYALDDLRHINRCGYFDYQREKVFVKTHKHLRKISDSRQKRKSHNFRPNKIVDIVLKKCPTCSAKNLKPTNSRYRHLLDLRFTKSGVKRAVIRIRCWSYICPNCGHTATARTKFSSQQIYGHDLMSYCVYFNVVCGLNMLKVQKCLEHIFGVRVENAQLYRFKRYVAANYSSLDHELLGAIVKSPVVHIDETTVNLREHSGYVWVVTTMDMVHFFYRPSREASFLSEMFGAFSGILVSDFFTGYDSMPCPQQKCLVHLVRELDEDLIHNPFDEQFKILAQSFGSLLRTIVETVDCYGLKKRHLAKHRRDVDRYLNTIDMMKPDSELVEKYRKRFLKYWPKMFTFLNYDGVPWNNNNAEHAIKRFAKYRRNADGCYTERSLKEYLVLASVLETCEFNKVNVLKFLLSKEATLEGFLRMARRTRQPIPNRPIRSLTKENLDGDYL
jgi:predicted RecB family nuclease